ncbi:MAG: hypothetical protein R2795_16310 [Saprospiraceae bacterium]
MRYLLPFGLVASILLGVGACGEPTSRDIRDYYFPLKELTSGRVYEYRDTRYDSLSPDYWYYLAVPTDSAWFFTKTYYQADYLPRGLYREKVVGNGLLLDALTLYEFDSTGTTLATEATILGNNVFPFEVRGVDDIYIYQVRFQLPSQPHGSTTVLINRRFAGDTTYTWKGQTYPAVYFTLVGSVDQRDSIAGAIEPQFTGKEIYAKGVGLVWYERHFSEGGPSLQYQLTNQLPMSELEQKAKELWQAE